MCNLTDSIKFCTCKSSSTKHLQNYWQLYRRNPDRNIVLVGEPIFLPHLITLNYEANKITLLKRINEADAFDIPIVFKNQDVLEVVLENTNENKRVVFGFKYRNAKWNNYEIDSFYLEGHFDEKEFGKIKNNT